MKDLTKIKFKENGDFNHFPGNTVVSNLYKNEQLMEVVDLVQTEFRDLPFIDNFTLTPPDSIHMTVMELLCHDNREKEFWSKDLALDVPLEEANRYFYERLTDFPLVDEKIVMKPVQMGQDKIFLEPANAESSQRLKAIRDYISERTGVRFANHNSYQFHISIGYLREPLTEVEKQIFDGVRTRLTQLLLEKLPLIPIERIEFTVFEDMTKFVPYLPEEK